MATALGRLFLLVGLLSAPLQAAEETAGRVPGPAAGPGFVVSHVSGARVYLNGGRARGLVEGTTLELRRDGVPIANLIVEFVADHSASCRVVEGSTVPVPGDRAVLAAAEPVLAAAEPILAASSSREGAATGTAPEPERPQRSSAPEQYPAPKEPLSSAPPAKPTLWGQASGSISLGWRGFADSGPFDRGWSESGARFSLRLLDVAQSAWSLRARMRRREITRDRDWSTRNPRTESDDRLYELSMVYEKPEGRAIVHLGRLSASPFVSLGTLDGALGQFAVSRHVALGGFYGSAAEVEEIGFQSLGEKYGAYARLFSTPPGQGSTSRLVSALVVGVIGEYDGGEVSRQYMALETRLRHGSRWHLFQRAELDLQSGWRQELTGRSSQLSNLSLSSSLRVSSSVQLLLSYDQFRPYRDAETRDTPEQLFDDVLRQGLRAGISFGGARGLRGSTLFGLRREQEGGGSTYSLQTTLLYSARNRLFYGADLSGWGGDVSDGYLATVNVGRAFTGGHDARLTLGHSSTTAAIAEGARTQDWVRLGGRLDLPAGLFVYAEAESVSGDDREGERFLLDLGYRF
jgi:hypothetical protein